MIYSLAGVASSHVFFDVFIVFFFVLVSLAFIILLGGSVCQTK